MNWGKSIVIVFVLFAAFIIYMVVGAFQQNVDLVADDYYAQEINYQKKLEQKANLSKLEQKVEVKLVDQTILLTFPEGHDPEGEIYFYHPSREQFDRKIEIETNDANIQAVQRKDLIAGRYRVNISWKSEGESYYQQEQLFIK